MRRENMHNPYKEVLEKQLAIDYDCTIEEVHSKTNIFRIMKRNKGARPIGDVETLLKIAVYEEKLLVMADAKLIKWCKETFNAQKGTWFSEPQNLISIHNKLQEYGQQLADTHHYYIPESRSQLINPRYDVRWYEQEEIEVFRGDKRFGEALLFDVANWRQCD